MLLNAIFVVIQSFKILMFIGTVLSVILTFASMIMS